MLLCVKQTANAGIASIISWLLEMGGMVAAGVLKGSLFEDAVLINWGSK